MSEVLDYPVRAYDYVYGNYGIIGVMFSALMLIFVGLFIWHWLESRK